MRLCLASPKRGIPWAPKALFGSGRQAQSPKPPVFTQRARASRLSNKQSLLRILLRLWNVHVHMRVRSTAPAPQSTLIFILRAASVYVQWYSLHSLTVCVALCCFPPTAPPTSVLIYVLCTAQIGCSFAKVIGRSVSSEAGCCPAYVPVDLSAELHRMSGTRPCSPGAPPLVCLSEPAEASVPTTCSRVADAAQDWLGREGARGSAVRSARDAPRPKGLYCALQSFAKKGTVVVHMGMRGIPRCHLRMQRTVPIARAFVTSDGLLDGTKSSMTAEDSLGIVRGQCAERWPRLTSGRPIRQHLSLTDGN